MVGEGEEVAGEEEVQACSEGEEESDGVEKTFLFDLYFFLRDEPEHDDQDGNDEEEEADGVAVGGGAGGGGGCWVQGREMHGVEC